MGSHDRSFNTDPLILNPVLKIEWDMAKGQMGVQGDEILVKGIFEK